MNEETIQEKSAQTSATKKKTALIIVVVAAVLLIGGTIFGIYKLSGSEPAQVSTIRDIFIIVLAFESLLIGAALVILIIQLALLSNMIQHEVRPILHASKDTIQTVQGTSRFISDKAVTPIISIAGLIAGGRKLFELVGFIKKSKKE